MGACRRLKPSFAIPLLAALPHGSGLPDDLWAARHAWMLRILYVHVPLLLAISAAYGFGFWQGVQHVMPILVLALLASHVGSRRARALLAATALLSCSALLVHVTRGLIEAHFHFFVAMTVLAFYEDWSVYGLSVVYVLLHHGVVGAVLDDRYPVFAHADLPHVSPWGWAALHALFILASGAANTMLWRVNEQSRQQAAAEAEQRARSDAIAATLTQSFVPSSIPLLPHVTTSALYRPGEGAIGGDFYEVIALGDGRIGVGLGDVAGHGAQAAALTAKLRHTLRAYATDGLEPASVMDKLERALGTDGTATCAYLVVDPAMETVTMALAGHLPPVIRRADGSVEMVAAGLSVPLAGLGIPHVQETRPFPAGSTLVVYTDGLVERRRESIDVGLRRLRDVISTTDGEPHRLCQCLPELLLADGVQPDDVAVVALRTDNCEPKRGISSVELLSEPRLPTAG